MYYVHIIFYVPDYSNNQDVGKLREWGSSSRKAQTDVNRNPTAIIAMIMQPVASLEL